LQAQTHSDPPKKHGNFALTTPLTVGNRTVNVKPVKITDTINFGDTLFYTEMSESLLIARRQANQSGF